LDNKSPKKRKNKDVNVSAKKKDVNLGLKKPKKEHQQNSFKNN